MMNNSKMRSVKIGKKFVNANMAIKQDMSKLGSIIYRYLFEKRVDAVPESVPVNHIDLSQLPNSYDYLYRLGHSSLLLCLSGKFWLIDPVFSERVSPVQWAGPKRFHPVPFAIEQLPALEGVLISHDHYDHLDKATIKMIHQKVKHFVVPTGVEQHLINFGVAAEKIQSLDWWQQVKLNDLNITATPAEHFSGRGMFDGNQTLWASWVIQSPNIKLFYSGDSGYFDGFKLIGEKLGPFDVTLIETGAYDKDWATIHMMPEQSVQAHLDVKGKVMIPVHNGTFDLALHAWYDPFVRVSQAAAQQKVQLATPQIGEQFRLDMTTATSSWWQNHVSEQYKNVEKSLMSC